MSPEIQSTSLKSRRDRREIVSHLLILLAVTAFCVWPVVLHGFPDRSDDGPGQSRQARQFMIQLSQGEWYPRWLDRANGGLGAPVYFFYPPLPSYAASIFWPVIADRDPQGWRVVGLGAALAMLLGAFTGYFWLRSLSPPRAALFGALVYVVAPYHICIDLYKRGAYAELWGFVWFPLIMLAVQRLVSDNQLAFPALAASYGLQVFTHPPITLCLSPVVLAYALLFSQTGRRIRMGLAAAVAMSLGAGVGAAFLLPGMLDLRKAHTDAVLQGFFDYRTWWLFQVPRSALDLKAALLFVAISTLIAAAALFCLARHTTSGQGSNRLACFYFAVAVGGFFFTTQLSSIFWRMVPLLRFLMFPWRFLTVTTLAAAALGALAYPALRTGSPGFLAWGLAGIALVWVAADGSAAEMVYSRWRPMRAENAQLTRDQMRLLREYPYWWPAASPVARLFPIPELDKFLAEHPAKTATLASFATGKSIGSVSVSQWRPRHVVLGVSAPEASRLTLVHFYYPDWRGCIIGQRVDIPVVPSQDGLIQMDVPKGQYELALSLSRDLPERAGIAVSCGSVLLLFGIFLWSLFQRTRPAS